MLWKITGEQNTSKLWRVIREWNTSHLWRVIRKQNISQPWRVIGEQNTSQPWRVIRQQNTSQLWRVIRQQNTSQPWRSKHSSSSNMQNMVEVNSIFSREVGICSVPLWIMKKTGKRIHMQTVLSKAWVWYYPLYVKIQSSATWNVKGFTCYQNLPYVCTHS